MAKWKNPDKFKNSGRPKTLWVRETIDKAFDKDGQILENLAVEYTTTGWYDENKESWQLFVPATPGKNIENIFKNGCSVIYSDSVEAKNRELKIVAVKRISHLPE